MPEFTDITIPTLFHYFLQHPFLHYIVIFMKFLPLVHALFSSLKCIFFYVDYGILYEELLVHAKKTQVVLHLYDLCACTYANVYI